jgi:predicted transcriptional regulator YdeE
VSIRNVLMRLFADDMSGVQPHIVDLQQPIFIIGMAVDTDLRRIYRDVPALGKQFRKYKQTYNIPNTKQPWAFAAVSKDFDKASGAFSYIMGDVVTRLDTIPAGLVSFEIPAQKYVVFPVRPKSRWGWGIAIANTKRYA